MSAAPTAFMRIAAAVQARLQAAPAISAHVDLARVRVLPEQGWTALVVRSGGAAREQGVGFGTPAIWSSALILECYARGTLSCPVADAADALLGAAVQRLMQEPTLGGLVANLDLQSIDWEFDADGAQAACITVGFLVRHASAADNLIPL